VTPSNEKAAIKAAARGRRGQPAPTEPAAVRPITLGQRAYPLIEMLRAAEKKKVDVTWGV
jgi:hypothetical protein